MPYGNLGNVYYSLGNFKQAIKCTTTIVLVLPKKWGTELERAKPMEIWAMRITVWVI